MTKLTEALIIQNAHRILSDEKHYQKKGDSLIVIKKNDTYTFVESK